MAEHDAARRRIPRQEQGSKENQQKRASLISYMRRATMDTWRRFAGDKEFSKRVNDIATENDQLLTAYENNELSRTDLLGILSVRQASDERDAGIDHLTGISNRARLERDANRILESAERAGTPVSVAMLDIDDFKGINDDPDQGHAVGDAVLLHFAGHIKTQLRENIDAFGRLSGGADEFAVVFAGLNAQQALEVIERIKADLAPNISEAVTGMGLNLQQTITMSAGIADTTSLKTYSLPRLLRAADTAVYTAKNQGKGRGKNLAVISSTK